MIFASTALVTSPVSIFLIVLVIILLAPMVLNKLKIPHIIGMIVAGVVVGPYGLNILDNDSSFDIFGQVGLLYLMFLAGLEIDMFHLRRNLRRGLAFGVLTFTIPMVMGVAVSVYVLHQGWLTAFLLASMYASHTLIGYPVAARYGVTQSPAVLISVVGTIVAVVGALLVLAGVVNIHDTGGLQPGSVLMLLLRMAVYVALVLYAWPRTTRWFFKRYSDKVTQYVFVMVMVFLSAWISGKIGLEPVLGAFLAGLIMNRYIPFNSPLMSSIEFVGNALFIPYFLIGVGMLINLSVIFSGATLLVAGIMLAVALAGKWLAAWIFQRATHMQPCDRRMLFGLTTAHTAVALAVVTIGYNMITADGLRMIDETVLNGTVLVILVTCAVAPLLTSEAAGKIKIRLMSEEPIEEKSTRRNVATLIPVSNPLTASELVDLSILMRLRTRGTYSDRLYALHVRNDNSPSARAVSENALRLASQAATAADARIDLIERYDINTVTGILNTLEERGIDRLVIGMHRRQTVIDSFLGSKIDQLLAATNRMVVIMRCYIPVNTVTRILAYVPPKAEYESGATQWMLSLASLAAEVGCRLIFFCAKEQQPLVRGVIANAGIGLRLEFITTSAADDFVMMARHTLDDDLVVTVMARPNSVSYNSQLAEVPSFLQRCFERNNLCIIYPEQSGDEVQPPTFTDPLGSDIVVTAAPWWLRLRRSLRRLRSHP